jgi:predicted HTH transcriptional regulator
MGGQMGGQIEELLTDKQIEVLNMIKENPYVSRKELSKQVSVNESVIQKHLDNLKKKGLIDREGKTKGYWKILENDNSIAGGQMGGQMGGQIGGQIEEPADRQIEILNIIKRNPYVSRKELSKQMNVNESAIQKHLDNLKKKGFIDREGKTKGYWKILKSN